MEKRGSGFISAARAAMRLVKPFWPILHPKYNKHQKIECQAFFAGSGLVPIIAASFRVPPMPPPAAGRAVPEAHLPKVSINSAGKNPEPSGFSGRLNVMPQNKT
jgi:hypothetical protein